MGKAKKKARSRASSDYRVDPKRRAPTAFQIAGLVEVIRHGTHFAVACKAVGIHFDTFQDWLDLARKGHPEYQEFGEAIDKAEAESEALAVRLVREAAEKGLKRTRQETRQGPDGVETVEVEEFVPDWRAAGWLLEHRFGERFAALRKLQHGGALTHRQVVVLHEGDPSLERDDWDAVGKGPTDGERDVETQADAEAEAGGEGGD